MLRPYPSKHMENRSSKPEVAPVEKLAYSVDEACAAIGVSRTSIWRLEKRGLIRAVPHIRTKLYSLAELKRFLNGEKAT